MITNVSKIIGIPLLILLGSCILLGCRKESSSPGPSPTPAAQLDETSNAENTTEGSDPVASEVVTPELDLDVVAATRVLIPDQITTLEPYSMIDIHPDLLYL